MPALPTYSRYAVRVLNSSRVTQGQIAAFKRLLYVRRFNAVSDWGITIDANDPMAQTLITAGANLQISRTVYDAATHVVKASKIEMRGPMMSYSYDKNTNEITAAGKDDMLFIAARLAWPVTTIPYQTAWVAYGGRLRWFKLNNTSGTVATDYEQGFPGTYNANVLLAQAPYLVDIGGLPAYFNGTNARVSTPTFTNLPTGNNTWTIRIWFMIDAYPSSGNATLMWAGTASAKQLAGIKINSSGGMFADVSGSGTTATSAVSKLVPHMAAATWDGTNLRFYLDGVLAGGPSAIGPLNVVYADGAIGAFGTGSEFFKGWLSSSEWFNIVHTPTNIANDYALGVTRFAAAAYDVQTGLAENVMRLYVLNNCISGAVDQYGKARAVPGLSNAASGGAGTTVTGNARFDKLVSKDGLGLLQALAQAGGGLGFYINPATTEFTVYVPVDKSGLVRFSDALGGVQDFAFSRTAPDWESGGNALIVAGGGDLTLRTFVATDDQTSLGVWGRFEALIDARDVSDYLTLAQRGAENLKHYSDTDTFTAKLIQGQNTVYGVDWDLGNKVTVVASGVAYSDLVRAVEVNLVGREETITPRVGAPGTEFADTSDVTVTHNTLRDLRLHERLAKVESRK